VRDQVAAEDEEKGNAQVKFIQYVIEKIGQLIPPVFSVVVQKYEGRCQPPKAGQGRNCVVSLC